MAEREFVDEELKTVHCLTLMKNTTAAMEANIAVPIPSLFPTVVSEAANSPLGPKEMKEKDLLPALATTPCLPSKKWSIAFGAIKQDRVTTLIPFLATTSGLVHTTDTIHLRRATIFNNSDNNSKIKEEIRWKNSQYHFLSPRRPPLRHTHPETLDIESIPRERPGHERDIPVCVGVPRQLKVWVNRARDGAPKDVPAPCWWGGVGVGVGAGNPTIRENAMCPENRIVLVVSSHRWSGGGRERKNEPLRHAFPGGDVRLASDGSLVYSVERKSVSTNQALILRDNQGRKIWKLSERTGFTGFNYDLYQRRLKQSESTHQRKFLWHLVGTMDRISPSSCTGHANSIFSTISEHNSSQSAKTEFKREHFIHGRVGVGGVLGVASSLGCSGDSQMTQFSRLFLKWNEPSCTARTSRRNTSRIIDSSKKAWELVRECSSTGVMMGDPAGSFRFLDFRTSRHTGTFIKLSEQPHTTNVNPDRKLDFDKWELVVEPPVFAENSPVKPTVPPEMLLAAGLVAQMMVHREGGRKGTRGLSEGEMGLSRKV
ncbi:hypothetical protein HDU84_006907 [Entophlyctis sp. JEL0112]|nr:hypothetical protein HDU84_006907 [Entophlyctis sp. JEL0112]